MCIWSREGPQLFKVEQISMYSNLRKRSPHSLHSVCVQCIFPYQIARQHILFITNVNFNCTLWHTKVTSAPQCKRNQMMEWVPLRYLQYQRTFKYEIYEATSQYSIGNLQVIGTSFGGHYSPWTVDLFTCLLLSVSKWHHTKVVSRQHVYELRVSQTRIIYMVLWQTYYQ